MGPVRTCAVIGVILASLGFTACEPARPAAEREETAKEHEPRDHVACSTPIVKRWDNLVPGSPAYALDDLAADPNWVREALFQEIDFQTGHWNVEIEPGHTVFRIYPYLQVHDPQPCLYQGIVIKINRELFGLRELKSAIRDRDKSCLIVEYDLFSENVQSGRRKSRR